jgi:hypothetical protein
MTDDRIDRHEGGPLRLTMNTLESSRKALARIIRLYAADKLEAGKARTLGYLFAQYLAYWKVEDAAAIERRIAALEDALRGQRT